MKLITKERLRELLIAEAFVTALKRNGIEYWEGYEETLCDDSTGMSVEEFASQSPDVITKDFETIDVYETI